MKLKNILCPIDYSSASQAALQMAAKLARQNNAVLHILHVYELVFVDAYIEGMAPIPIPPDMEAIERRLRDVKPEGVRVEHELGVGLPSSTILNYAASHHVDLIVMGAKTVTGIERWLIGSVTESVMRSAACPVLNVHDEVDFSDWPNVKADSAEQTSPDTKA